MLNQLVLVGRLVATPKLEEGENNKKYSKITLAVTRSFKNADGAYETDFIDIILWEGIAQNTAEYCNKGDIIGVKGRIQTQKLEDRNEIQIIAEKVTFLSSKKSEEKEED